MGVAHFSGFRFGGFRGAGFHADYRHVHYNGGYYYPHYRGAYYVPYGGYYPSYNLYGYGSYGGYYRSYIPYGFYGGYYPYYNPYGYWGMNNNPGYDGSYMSDYYGYTSDSYDPFGAGKAPAVLPEVSGNNAVINVHVPIALADVAFDGQMTRGTGKDRIFTTPQLTPGETYTYTVTASWTEGGLPRAETRTVQVQAGQSATVDFSKKQ
jgi:uncharacterized protein (TIGR03000 family)